MSTYLVKGTKHCMSVELVASDNDCATTPSLEHNTTTLTEAVGRGIGQENDSCQKFWRFVEYSASELSLEPIARCYRAVSELLPSIAPREYSAASTTDSKSGGQYGCSMMSNFY